jgi:hypothetical protein
MNKQELAETRILAKRMYEGLISWSDLTEYQTVLLKDFIDSNGEPITYERVEHQEKASM